MPAALRVPSRSAFCAPTGRPAGVRRPPATAVEPENRGAPTGATGAGADGVGAGAGNGQFTISGRTLGSRPASSWEVEAGFASSVGPPAAADELSKNIWWKNIRYRDSPGGTVTSNETLDRSFGNGVSWAVTPAGAARR